jgi:aryl-phospho-beta-D-glucosidase BglC (GH1 family)
VLDRRFGYAERQRLYTLFRDNWITERDWDLLPQLNLNLVRLPFIYSVVEMKSSRASCAPMRGSTSTAVMRPSSAASM